MTLVFQRPTLVRLSSGSVFCQTPNCSAFAQFVFSAQGIVSAHCLRHATGIAGQYAIELPALPNSYSGFGRGRLVGAKIA
jgi:hypothetical protein